jgi:hypothetical protein
MDKFLQKDQREHATSCILHVLRSFDKTLADRYRNDYTNIVERLSVKKFEPGFLITIASSDAHAENQFWLQVFPRVIRSCFERCPTVVQNCMDHVYQRLLTMQPAVAAAADPSRSQNATLTSKFYRSTAPATDDIIDQWKFYLLFAFATAVCYHNFSAFKNLILDDLTDNIRADGKERIL